MFKVSSILYLIPWYDLHTKNSAYVFIQAYYMESYNTHKNQNNDNDIEVVNKYYMTSK